MIAVLALAAAFGWGTSDFAAGVASRRASAMSVVILTHLTATIALVVACLDLSGLIGASFGVGTGHGGHLWTEIAVPAIGVLGHPSGPDLLWGLGAGISGGVGALLLYQGLAKGSMAVVAPVTAAGAAALPALYGLVTGDATSPVTIGGIVLALVAITLVSSTGTDSEEAQAAGPSSPHHPPAADVRRHDDAVIERAYAALRSPNGTLAVPVGTSVTGYVGALLTAILAGSVMAMTTAALAGTVDGSMAGVSIATGAAVALGATGTTLWIGPRARARVRRPRTGRLAAPGLAEALGSGVGFALFYILSAHAGAGAGLWPMVTARGGSFVVFTAVALITRNAVVPVRGTRRTIVLAGVLDAAAAGLFLIASRSGSLAIVAVLSSMYPGVTVLLARAVTKERCSRLQLVGLGVAATAIGVIAVG